MNERIKKIKEEHIPKYFSGDRFVKPMHISILRTRVYTQVWKETEGEPMGIRRAKAFARYLKEMPIFIHPRSLLVGYFSEAPDYFQYCVESADPVIINEYIKMD